MVCDTMRDRMRDGFEAEKQPTWTNAPLVRSARAAAILEFWRAKRRLGPPEPNALKTGFREAADRLPAHRR